MKLKIFFTLVFCSLISVLKAQEFKSDTSWRYKRINSISIYNGIDSTITFYNSNGDKYSVLSFKYRKKEGISRYFFENDQVNREELYHNDFLVLYKEWYKSGQLRNVEHYATFNEPPINYKHGKSIHYFADGSVETEGQYEKGKQSGKWIVYFQNDKKKSEYYYKQGLQIGNNKTWFESGKLKSNFNFIVDSSNDKYYRKLISFKDGKQEEYFLNGTKKYEIHYKKNELHGTYKTWFESGKPHEDFNYNMGAYIGVCKKWYENYTLAFEKHYGKPKEIKRTKYNSNSNIGQYNSVYDGLFLENYNDGNIKEKGFYKDGVKHGKFEEYHPDKKPNRISTYDNGKLIDYISYYTNGQLVSHQTYRIDSKTEATNLHGLYIKYYEDGVINDSGWYNEGKREGVWISRHKNGRMSSYTKYCNNVVCGDKIEWDYQGYIKFKESILQLPNDTSRRYLQEHYNELGQLSSINILDKNRFNKYYTTYWSNGALKKEVFLINPIVNSSYGSYSEAFRLEYHYFPNGNMNKCYIISEDKFIGRQLEYYMNGRLKSIKDYEDSRYETTLEALWDSDGEIIHFSGALNEYSVKELYVSYKNSRDLKLRDSIVIDGEKYLRVGLDENKTLLLASYDGKLLTGDIKAFHQNGKLALKIVQNKINALDTIIYFASNGDTLNYATSKNGKRIGVKATWNYTTHKMEEWSLYSDSNILIASKRYENGVLNSYNKYLNWRLKNNSYFISHGEQKYWHKNGQLRNVYTSDTGKTIGWAYQYYPNGVMESKSFYANGLKDSVEMRYDSFGRVASILKYKSGELNGRQYYYWENGKIKYSGVRLLGKNEGEWTTYDSLGNVLKINQYKNGRLVISYGSSSCFCSDSFNTKFSFVPLLNGLATLEKVREWSFKFHAPISEEYDHLFYRGLFTNSNRNWLNYTFDIITFKPLKLAMGANNKLQLILNPCRKIGDTYTPMRCSVSVDETDKSKTDVRLDTKILALEFSKNLLKEMPSGKDSLNWDTDVPTLAYFKSDELRYNSNVLLDVSSGFEPYCFPWSLLGNTGLKVHIKDFNVDLNPESSLYYNNYYSYYGYYDKKPKYNSDLDKNFMNAFVGLVADTFKAILPKSILGASNDVPVIGKNILIGGTSVIGTLILDVTLSNGLLYALKSDGSVTFTSASIETEMKKLNFQDVQLKYNIETSQLLIYFNYTSY